MIREAERDAKFRHRITESAGRVVSFKEKSFNQKFSKEKSRPKLPAPPLRARVEKLTRQLWEFGEEIRLATLAGSRGDST